MRALLYMIDTEDDLRRAMAVCSGRGMKIVHRRCRQELDEDIFKRGWFLKSGCRILGLGATFADRWRLTGSPDPRGKPFTGLRVHFVGTSWDVPRELHEAQVEEAGGGVVDEQEQADIVVTSNIELANLGGRAAAMIITEQVFRRALPGARLTPWVVWSKPLNDQAANIWRLFSACDLTSIQLGINLACTHPEEIDDLLEGVEVGPTGELVRGLFLSVTADFRPFLNVALLGLLSVAPDGTRAAALRACVRKIAMTVTGIPNLNGFERLEALRLTLSEGTNARDLRTFGPLPTLRVLFIGSGSHVVSLSSLAGLDAPALVELDIANVDLRDVDALARSPRLQSVNLERNQIGRAHV